jgi:hypothetical protein
MNNPIMDEYGNKKWFNFQGEFHRDDGPAIEMTNGYKEWCQNGKAHREDGPAIEYRNGTRHWYINGKRII